MIKLMDGSINFFKQNTVFSVSLILALISCFFVNPSINYLNYINWETIILLLVIMIIVEVLKNLLVFEILIRKLLTKIHDTRGLVFILVFICFLSSIVITNDVSLIMFVPFSIIALKKVNRTDLAVVTVCLQSIAANVGCMLLPTGSPHNIVLYATSNISFGAFFPILLPYVIVSLVFLFVVLFFIPKDDILLPELYKVRFIQKNFFKRVFTGVDYYLILTFIVLFILIGNLENISFFNELFRNCIRGNEVLCGVVASQFISNVPSAILLTGFSSNFKAIIIGINVGGFGTLIASMANLISFNIFVRHFNELKTRYLLVFTGLNVVLLLLLLCAYALSF